MKNNTLIKISTFLISLVIITAPAFALAQIQNPLGRDSTNITGFISSILRFITRVGGIIAIFAFIWSGFKFVQAQGNPKGLDDAKKIFTNTCIGVAILLGAELIASILVGTIKSLR